MRTVGAVRLTDERISIQMLTTDGHHAMMPVINVYDEGGGMADPTRHDGEEFVHVIDGRVELTVGSGDPIVLEAGDSAYYRSDVPHSFRNADPASPASSASPHRPTSRGAGSYDPCARGRRPRPGVGASSRFSRARPTSTRARRALAHRVRDAVEE